jgi:hypothetical protein
VLEPATVALIFLLLGAVLLAIGVHRRSACSPLRERSTNVLLNTVGVCFLPDPLPFTQWLGVIANHLRLRASEIDLHACD